MMRTVCGAVIAAWIVVCAPVPVHGAFERMPASARVAATGGAFVSVADDAAAALTNPAGLAGLGARELLITGRRPWGLNVNEAVVAAAAPFSWGAGALAWTYRGLGGAYAENVLSLALARDITRTSEDASLSVGIALDASRAAVSERFDESDTAFSLGGGVLLRPFPMIALAYNVRNANAPRIHLVSAAGTELHREQSWGMSWYWNDRVTISMEQRRVGNRAWTTRGGVEVALPGSAALRSGISQGRGTFGIGMVSGRYGFDFAYLSGGRLGSTAMVTLNVRSTAGGGDASRR